MKTNDDLIHTDESLPSEVYTTHYSVSIYCNNCNEQDSVMVKKGVLKRGLSTECTNCGCKVKL